MEDHEAVTYMKVEIISSDIPVNRLHHLMWIQMGLLAKFVALFVYVVLAIASPAVLFDFGAVTWVMAPLLIVGAALQGFSYSVYRNQTSLNEADPTNPNMNLNIMGKPMIREIVMSLWISTLAVGFTVWILLNFVLSQSTFPWPFQLDVEDSTTYRNYLNNLFTACLVGIVPLVRAVLVHWNPVVTVTPFKKFH
jgi:hypothetical protein